MGHTENLNLNKSRTFGEKLGDTFTFARVNAGALLQVHLFISLPIIILFAGIFYLLFTDYFSLLGAVDSGVFIDDVSRRRETWAWFIQNILFPAFAVLPVSANTFIVMDLYEKGDGEKVSFQATTKAVAKQLPKLMAAKLIMLPLIMIVMLVTVAADEVVFSITFAILLAPISIVFYTIFTCVELLILQHQYSIGGALSYSSKIIGRYFWMTFGSNFVILIIYLFLTFAMEFPSMALDTLEGITIFEMDMDSFWSVFTSALRGFSGVVGYLLFSFVSINAGIQYFSLKEKNNRKNIMDRIRMIGEAEPMENIYAEDEQY